MSTSRRRRRASPSVRAPYSRSAQSACVGQCRDPLHMGSRAPDSAHNARRQCRDSGCTQTAFGDVRRCAPRNAASPPPDSTSRRGTDPRKYTPAAVPFHALAATPPRVPSTPSRAHGKPGSVPVPREESKTATAEPPPANGRPARLPTSRSSDPDRPGASSPPTISPRPGDPGGSRQSGSSAQRPDCDPIPVDDACAAGHETPPRPSPPHVAPRPRPMPPAHSPTPGPDSPKPVPGPMPPDAPPATPPPDAPPAAATPCRPTRCTTPPDDSASLHARKSPEPGTTESPTDPSTSP